MSESSPSVVSPRSSHGPQRTPRSPLSQRYGPYDSDRGRHSQNENWMPSGPGQSGNFPQYIPYNGPSRTYDHTQFSITDQNSRLPALTTLVSVDELSTQYGLDSAQRKAAHTFCKLGSEDRSATLFLRLLKTERQNEEIQEQMQQMLANLEDIAAYCKQTWKPSKEQTKLLKALLRHYLIRPITSYNNLVAIVETYIVDHTASLRLELYKKDPTVKQVVHEMLAAENNAQRSALRKLVFNSVKEKNSLDHFCKKIINSYHLPTLPTSPPQDIMASLALMRQIAKPLLGKDTTRGGDTGFWADLESELDVLYAKNGNERDSAEWRKWELEIITQDNRKYNRHAAESNARTQAEIDAAMLVPPSHANPAAGENEDDDEGMVNEDRQVHISGLGNLAALAAGPVSRSGA
ncbi:hypothetical protein C8F04DRAFT_1392767 [Mycena alexandri]|uniref:Uncharacterized protein n=1 Tax=Mycena alexandri TaxID=1745969 RepID=A0AAD6T3D8_9AGAR|nr:hypothetical protein C8F04DRAFT_1392767 [Mycena alexandri]